MGNPTLETQVLSPSSSGRTRRSTDSYSPEFEFWMVRNPSFPQPNLLSADELFVDGVLRPLHLLSHSQPDPEKPNSDPQVPISEPGPGPKLTSKEESKATTSKRWRDLFKKNNKEKKDKVEKVKKERKSQSGTSSAELNINIWPFSRSRSAGISGTRPRQTASSSRRVSSAPCSRSNSAGESKSRKWPSSPGRVGVHIGRSSPVWKVRRGVSSAAEERGRKEGRDGERSKFAKSAAVAEGSGGKARILNLNVPMCIGYKQNLSCRSQENRSGSGGGGQIGAGSGTSNVGGGVNIFNLRSFFTSKKVH